ncbi:saccharopine dehydrogenase family protein [Desulfatibacillum aliphaticivorans]|uniref:saccharopine dehydrogenase family protein n=1 Tax=Desulfatibacillum aliphaticivorans TaxID=218208 RepID=UPI00041C2958|nr:saccharopine dehydrogenase NADP-binding domain-containing protein [Desulfatibacillum aliphaticivorans]
MKILALGGCGEMGAYAVRALLDMDKTVEIVVADRNGDAAKSFVETLPDRASWIQLDISNPSALEAAVAEADVVMNTVGPYFRFGVLVLKACIRCGRDYVDICDDWEPTLDMLDLDKEAAKAGITAIVGMGASPGISNMLAVKAVKELDRAAKAYTGWDLDSAKPENVGKNPSAATIHGIHQLTGKIRAFEKGRYLDKRPIERLSLNYPGVGVRNAWTMGHPEAVTLPRYFSALELSRNVMVSDRLSIFLIKAITTLVDVGVISPERAAWLAERAELAKGESKSPEARLSAMAGKKSLALPPLFALAQGEKNGGPASAACMITSAPSGGMAGATGAPLAVGAWLLAQGKVEAKGVFAPEGCLNPEAFFDSLGPLCTPPRKSAEELTLTTRSWEKVGLGELLQLKFTAAA